MNAPITAQRSRLIYFLISISVALADQFTKWLVAIRLPLYHSYIVIPRFFMISHVQNPGAAFSLFANAKHASEFLSVFTAISILVLMVLLWRENGFTRVGLSMALIIGGAAGNLTDRIRMGSVLDFLAFDVGTYHWPDFNLADSSIVLGVILIAWTLLFSHKQN